MTDYDVALGSQYLLRLSVVQASQDVVNNTSTDNWSATIFKLSGSGRWTFSADRWQVVINGNVYGGSFTYDFRSYSSLTVGSGSTVVPHNSDGSKVTPVSATFFDDQANLGSGTAFGNFGQTTIPRASTPTFEQPSGTPVTIVEAGSTVLIRTNRADSSFIHTIEYSIGASSGTIASGVGATTNWTPALALMNEFPSNPTGAVLITTKTYNAAGTVQIGSATTTTLNLSVPSTVTPDFSTITNSEATSGLAANVGAYVKTLTKLALAITGAVGAYGSTIYSYKIEVDGQVINAQSGITPNFLTTSGTYNITGTVTDSRGKTKQKTVSITVLNYAPPIITAITGQRALIAGTPDEEGTYIRVNINAAVQSLIVGTQKNELVYKIYTRARGATTWVLKKTVSSGAVTFNSYDLVSTYAITTAWEVLVEILDDFNTSSQQFVIATSTVFMHWGGPGEGIGIGKYWESGRGDLDIKGQAYQNDGKAILDTTYSTVNDALVSATRLAARFRNRIMNGDLRVNNRQYVSGKHVGPAGSSYSWAPTSYYCDRWRAPHVNLIGNGSFEANIGGWAVEATAAITLATSGGLYGSNAMRWQINTTAAAGSTAAYFANIVTVVGRRYTMSAYVKSVSGTRSIKISDVSSNNTVSVATSAVWQRITWTFVATAALTYVNFYSTGTGASGDAILIDGVMMTEGDTLWHFVPQSDQPVLNMFSNPSFEGPLFNEGWNVNICSLSVDTGWAASGSQSLRLTAGASAINSFAYLDGDYNGTGPNRNGMVSGQTYTVSGTFNLTAPLTGAVNGSSFERAIVVVYLLGGVVSYFVSPQAPNVAGTTRLSLTFTLPVGSTGAGIRFFHGHAGGFARWDAVQLEVGATLHNYMENSITLPTAAQGGLATLFDGARALQVSEQADIAAGTYTASHAGTAQIRVYNLGTTPPAFAAGPITVALDGTAHVVTEVDGAGGGKTFGKVQLELGSTPTPPEQRLLADELMLCSRYFRRWQGGYFFTTVTFQSTNNVAGIITCYGMRSAVDTRWANLWITDNIVYNNVVSAFTALIPAGPVRSNDFISFIATMSLGTSGTVRTPGGFGMQDGATNSFFEINGDF